MIDMIRSPHFIAVIITVIAIALFLVLKPVFGFQFGLRTYWPVFACLYLLVWYYIRIITTESKSQS